MATLGRLAVGWPGDSARQTVLAQGRAACDGEFAHKQSRSSDTEASYGRSSQRDTGADRADAHADQADHDRYVDPG